MRTATWISSLLFVLGVSCVRGDGESNLSTGASNNASGGAPTEGVGGSPEGSGGVGGGGVNPIIDELGMCEVGTTMAGQGGLGENPDIDEAVYQAVHDHIWQGCNSPSYDPLLSPNLCDVFYQCPDGYKLRVQCTQQEEGFVCASACGWVVMPGPREWACLQAMWFCSGICGAPGRYYD